MITVSQESLQGLKPLTDPLGIYLNDHLAGATAGLELFRRSAGAAPLQRRAVLQRLASEVEEDRAALVEVMATLEIPVRQYKVAAGWLGEKLGRLKPNGQLTGRSPLSSVLEVEALVLGVRGKAAAWQALRVVAERDGRLSTERLDELLARADRQREELELIRQVLARELFAPI
jgi:hypothetical protein